jgi:phosphatidate cytidylyltransferase
VSPGAGMSDLLVRTIVALVAAPVAIALVWLGGLPLAVFLAAIAGGCAWEFFRLARAGGIDPLDAVGIPAAAAVPLLVYGRAAGFLDVPLALGMVGVVAVLGIAIWARGTGGRPLGASAATVFGVLYTGGMLSFGYLLRAHPYAIGALPGTLVVALPLLLTWATDIGAYAVGSVVGGPKLLPSVSPGKTRSGAVGGLLLATLVCWLLVRYGLRPYAGLSMTALGIVLFGACISIAAQVGDLVLPVSWVLLDLLLVPAP